MKTYTQLKEEIENKIKKHQSKKCVCKLTETCNIRLRKEQAKLQTLKQARMIFIQEVNEIINKYLIPYEIDLEEGYSDNSIQEQATVQMLKQLQKELKELEEKGE